MNNYRSTIAHEFAQRKRKNPAYSLRAYARSLGISPGMLSEVLSGKRHINKNSALRIADRLCLGAGMRDKFLMSALGDVAMDSHIGVPEAKLLDLDLEQYRSIADWYYWAILSLGSLKSNRWDADWIAGRLGISQADAGQAMERLLALKFIEVKNSHFRQASPRFKVSSPVPSDLIRNGHRQILAKANEALEFPVEERDFSAVTMAVTRERLGMARQCIARFRHEMSSLLSTDNNDQVYTLSVQLFPLSKEAP